MKSRIYCFLLLMLTFCLISCVTNGTSSEIKNDANVETKSIHDAGIVKTGEKAGLTENEDALDYFKTGTEFLNAGKEKDSEPYFREAIRLDPGFVDAYDYLGMALRRMGKTDEAIYVLNQSINLNPYSQVPYSSLCIAYMDKGEFGNALKVCDAAIARIPDKPNAYYNKGIIFMNEGQYKEAIPYFDRAGQLFDKEKSSQMYDAAYNIGFCYYAIKDWDNAVIFMELALQNFPDDQNLQDFYDSALNWKKAK